MYIGRDQRAKQMERNFILYYADKPLHMNILWNTWVLRPIALYLHSRKLRTISKHGKTRPTVTPLQP